MATEAVLKTLEIAWRVVEQLGIDAAVAGGTALAFWRHPRTTLDVDLLVTSERASIERLVSILQANGFRLRSSATIDLGDTDLLQFAIEPVDTLIEVPLDILIAKSEFAHEALHRCVTVSDQILGFEIRILSCEDLIMLKLLAGRIIDRADVVALLRENNKNIDHELLDRLAIELGVTAKLEEARAELG